MIGALPPRDGSRRLCLGRAAGPILGPFGLPLIGCLKTHMSWYPILCFPNAVLRHYLWLSFPIMIGFSIVVVDEWIIKNQASYLTAGTFCRTYNTAEH